MDTCHIIFQWSAQSICYHRFQNRLSYHISLRKFFPWFNLKKKLYYKQSYPTAIISILVHRTMSQYKMSVFGIRFLSSMTRYMSSHLDTPGLCPSSAILVLFTECGCVVYRNLSFGYFQFRLRLSSLWYEDGKFR